MVSTCQCIRVSLVLFLAVCLQPVFAAPTDNDTANTDFGAGLLDGLLEELDGKIPELPEVNAPKATQPPSARETPKWMPDADNIQRNINRQLGGEDVGKVESPLAPIARRMGIAAELIGQNESSNPPRPVQEQVVSDLDKLIEQLEKECNSCNNPSQSRDQKKQASKRSKPKPSQAKKSGKPGPPKPSQSQSSAKTSTTRMGSADPVETQTTSNEELMKAAWGHLPPRLREQMIQSSSEEFLPEYREELKEYFKRLAEREAEEAVE